MRILFVIITLLFTFKLDKLPFEQEELADLLEVADRNDLHVKEWQIIYKGKVSRKQAKNLIRRMNFNEIEDINKEYKEYKLIQKTQGGKLIISYHLLSPKRESTYSHFTISINSREYPQDLTNPLKNVFTDKNVEEMTKTMKKYTCLVTENNDIMKKINLEENIIQILNLQNIQEHKDPIRSEINITEIYGYHKKWNTAIEVYNEPINFHLVQLEKKTNHEVIIGTPILIYEY